MYLFILESLGMSELLIIGAVALIVFGPRKLPEMAKMVGKMMAEFRRVTGEFKETWEKEASFEEEKKMFSDFSMPREKPPKVISNGKSENSASNNSLLPEIREIDPVIIKKEIEVEKIRVEEVKTASEKKNWL